MQLNLIRKYFTETTTIGELLINNEFFCHILEDADRGLFASMPLEEIKKKKVYAQTCIPYGSYKVINSYSPRFKEFLPLLLNVPGYAGIRIHPGNYASHTEGCLLPGKYSPKVKDMVSSSKVTFTKLMSLLSKASKKEEIIITITK